MNQNYSLKEISQLFNIPKSTLRYWENEGIIRSTRNEDNDYREYTTEDLIVINDINFYRTLNYPVKKLRNIYEMSVEENKEQLEDSLEKIEQEMEHLKQIKDKIHMQLTAYSLLNQLRNNQFTCLAPPFERIAYMHLGHAINVKEYLNNPHILAIVMDQNTEVYQNFGTIVPNETSNTLLWEKQSNCSYLPCLIKMSEKKVDRSLLSSYLNQIDTTMYTIGKIIGTFITTEYTEDYYQCWIELFKNKY